MKREDRCKLCGSKVGLEVHHIIPRVCGGEDSEENCIVICGECHGKLTPKALLTKAGIEKSREDEYRNDFLESFWKNLHDGCAEWMQTQSNLTPEALLKTLDFNARRWISEFRENEKQIGQKPGAKLTTKKSIAAKEIIMNHSKDFKGNLSDEECMKLAGIARNTFYKYKRELKAEAA